MFLMEVDVSSFLKSNDNVLEPIPILGGVGNDCCEGAGGEELLGAAHPAPPTALNIRMTVKQRKMNLRWRVIIGTNFIGLYELL